ncbi:putative AbiEii toxin of type IV toxin-antitoxin system [Flavobacterium sp. 9]|uniref:AAA family ATPase n=1 Tax=Flavobacterium sp. 9 TaxID=2035198 RepID=UPI000C1A3DC6|nr:AAA family ATPase [Flavobacterium sp. 9]PIF33851.1 putative AbiEii toxin of type IV toxin-antitoxin system [Flavobacterium sp. 9]
MKKISIKLNEKYKSFDESFETELEGDLIILSGINGSGKSQIINIINGKENKTQITSPNSSINRTSQTSSLSTLNISRKVLINDIEIKNHEIEYKSFKDNIAIPEIIKSTSNTNNTSINEAYRQYKLGKLNPEINKSYATSCLQAIKILGNFYNPDSFEIPEDIFKYELRKGGFIWKNDDVFTDFIGNIFYNYALEVAQGQQETGKKGGAAFNAETLGPAPWNELNQLFDFLKFDYRFKNSYEVKYGELNETPHLYQIDSTGKIIETEDRSLEHLSDGEKTIISLCFISLKRIENVDKKLLLFDELDAVLNPSLINSFFSVIEKYFIHKGITVILATHSPATISLAPEYTSYYEVFKKSISESRIYKIDRDEYLDLQKVNKRFYDKIQNQADRIKELESTIESDEDVLIITEGKTDWKYILKALHYFHNKEEFLEIDENFFYRFGTKEDVENQICGTIVIADLGESLLNSYLSNEISSRTGNKNKRKKVLIGIFDSDTDIKIKEKNEYGVYSFKIKPSGISTEFLFEEEKIKSKINGERLFIGNEFDPRTNRHLTEKLNLGSGSNKRAGKIEIIDTDVYDETNVNKALSKEKFAQAIFNGDIEITDKNWEKFRHIFETILKFIPKEVLGKEKK